MEPATLQSCCRISAATGAIMLVCAALLLSDGAAPPALAQSDCPPNPPQLRPCPWTPPGVEIQPCTRGFCWSGGYPNPLACKPEKVPRNARRTDLDDVVCNDGYAPERDPCTGVIVRCRGKGSWLDYFLPSPDRIRDDWEDMTAVDSSAGQRFWGALSLVGTGVELVMIFMGVFGLARAAAKAFAKLLIKQGVKATLSAAGRACLNMAKFKGEECLRALATHPNDLINPKNLPQLQKLVETHAKEIGEWVVKTLKEQGAKAVPRGEEMAGVVYELINKGGKLPEVLKEPVFKMLNQYFAETKWFDFARQVWRR